MKLTPILACMIMVPTTAAAQVQVELVVDASTTMNRQLSDYNTRISAVRDVLTTLEAALPPDGDELEISLRVFGGGHQLTDDEACTDQRLLFPMQAAQGAPLAASVADLRARGRSPLASALAAAAEDFDATSSKRAVLLITDGWDSCGGDVGASLSLLNREDAPVAVYVIAIAVDRDFIALLPPTISVHQVETGAEIATTLGKAISTLTPLDLEQRPYRVELAPPPESTDTLQISFTSSITGNTIPYSADEGVSLSAGVYAIRVVTDTNDVEFTRIIVNRQTPPVLELHMPELGEVVLGSVAEPGSAGSTIDLPYSGLDRADAQLCIGSEKARAADRRSCVALTPPAGEARLQLPPTPGIYDARLHIPSPLGETVIAARSPVPVLPADARWIELPQEVESGDPVVVMWDGAESPGDLLLLAPSDADVEEFVAWWSATAELHPLDLYAPDAGCEYELRYLAAATVGVPARSTMLVVEPEAELRGPRRVEIHQPFEVRWRGPGEANDYITVVAEAAADGDYGQLVPTTTGNPVYLTAPATAGSYELRYMSGHGTRVLDRVPIKVVTIPARLEAPDRVAAGSRFKVHWTGPNQQGDFVAVYHEGAAVGRHSDFAFTSLGTPASLAAPFDPCHCEIRYVSGVDGSVLAQRPLEVK